MTSSQFLASEKKLSELTRPELRDILQHKETPAWLYQALTNELLKRIQDGDKPGIYEWWENVRDCPLFACSVSDIKYDQLESRQQIAACMLYESCQN
jgi:hypothetical protein